MKRFFFFKRRKHWTPNQRNKTAPPKADQYPTSHFPPFHSCLSIVLKKGLTPKVCTLFMDIINSVFFLFFNLSCVWISLSLQPGTQCCHLPTLLWHCKFSLPAALFGITYTTWGPVLPTGNTLITLQTLPTASTLCHYWSSPRPNPANWQHSYYSANLTHWQHSLPLLIKSKTQCCLLATLLLLSKPRPLPALFALTDTPWNPTLPT